MSSKIKPLSREEIEEIFLRVVKLLKRPIKKVIEEYDVTPVLSNLYYDNYERWYRSSYKLKLTNDVLIDTRGIIEVLQDGAIYELDVPHDLHIVLSAWADKLEEYLEKGDDKNEGSN